MFCSLSRGKGNNYLHCLNLDIFSVASLPLSAITGLPFSFFSDKSPEIVHNPCKNGNCPSSKRFHWNRWLCSSSIIRSTTTCHGKLQLDFNLSMCYSFVLSSNKHEMHSHIRFSFTLCLTTFKHVKGLTVLGRNAFETFRIFAFQSSDIFYIDAGKLYGSRLADL